MDSPRAILDDRRFQNLVDDARQVLERRGTPPLPLTERAQGALIEATAFLVDQLNYRLNHLPDRLHHTLLGLLGMRQRPPHAARTDITFWTATPVRETVKFPAGLEVATEDVGGVSFTTTEPIILPATALSACLVRSKDDRDIIAELTAGLPVAVFGDHVNPGVALLIGLSAPAPACAILLAFECTLEGVGVNPRDPPLVWEAWIGTEWRQCEVERDHTGGLCRPGTVVLHLPSAHVLSVIAQQRAAWLRCRVLESDSDQPFYYSSPMVTAISASTVGGTVPARHGRVVQDEPVGTSSGLPGQRFRLRYSPVATTGEPVVVEVRSGSEWESWSVVPSFADSGPFDRHVVLDDMAGEVSFGPMIRDLDGSSRLYGSIPSTDAAVRIRDYWVSGGAEGNVHARELRVLRTPTPKVTFASVENRRGAFGGLDGESEQNLRKRAPLELRARNRAVTAGDYEYLASQAEPWLARVRCVLDKGEGAASLLIVPHVVEDELGQFKFEQLLPDEQSLIRIAT